MTPTNHTVSSARARHRLHVGALAALLLGVSIALGACGGTTTPTTSDGPVLSASALRGRVLFNQRCTSCHTPTERRSIGPGLEGVMDADGPTLPDGVDYGGNLPNGQPRTPETVADWIESGGQGEIGVMPPQLLSRDEINDVVAYLATLSR